jgi:hypothetical protein
MIIFKHICNACKTSKYIYSIKNYGVAMINNKIVEKEFIDYYCDKCKNKIEK